MKVVPRGRSSIAEEEEEPYHPNMEAMQRQFSVDVPGLGIKNHRDKHPLPAQALPRGGGVNAAGRGPSPEKAFQQKLNHFNSPTLENTRQAVRKERGSGEPQRAKRSSTKKRSKSNMGSCLCLILFKLEACNLFLFFGLLFFSQMHPIFTGALPLTYELMPSTQVELRTIGVSLFH
jgi:hypothetical protein